MFDIENPLNNDNDSMMKFINVDGFVKSPTSALRCILRFFKVRKVLIITQDLRALNLELFSLPSKSDFLRFYQR